MLNMKITTTTTTAWIPTTTTVTNTTKKKHKRGYDGICCPVIKSCYDVFPVKWKAVSAIEYNLVGPIQYFRDFMANCESVREPPSLFVYIFLSSPNKPNNEKKCPSLFEWLVLRFLQIEIPAKSKHVVEYTSTKQKNETTKRDRERDTFFGREKAVLNITRTWTMSNKQCMTYEHFFCYILCWIGVNETMFFYRTCVFE